MWLIGSQFVLLMHVISSDSVYAVHDHYDGLYI